MQGKAVIWSSSAVARLIYLIFLDMSESQRANDFQGSLSSRDGGINMLSMQE